MAAIMASLQSGYEPEIRRLSNARRYSAYHNDIEGIDSLRKANKSFPSLTNGTNLETSDSPFTSTDQTDIELESINALRHQENDAAESGFSLPPVDGGKDAWLFLLSAFVLEVLVWGIFFSVEFFTPR